MAEVPVEEVRAFLGRRGLPAGPVEVGMALRELGLLVSDGTVRSTVTALRRDSVGAGPLEPLLRLPGVTDVLVNAPDQVYLDRGQGLERVSVGFSGEAEVRRLAVRLAASVGRRLDDGSPFVDARLASGVRVHAVLGVVTGGATCLSLRVPRSTSLSLADWVAGGGLAPAAAGLLARVIERRRAFLAGIDSIRATTRGRATADPVTLLREDRDRRGPSSTPV